MHFAINKCDNPRNFKLAREMRIIIASTQCDFSQMQCYIKRAWTATMVASELSRTRCARVYAERGRVLPSPILHPRRRSSELSNFIVLWMALLSRWCSLSALYQLFVSYARECVRIILQVCAKYGSQFNFSLLPWNYMKRGCSDLSCIPKWLRKCQRTNIFDSKICKSRVEI